MPHLSESELKKQFMARLELFKEDVRNYPLDDHSLVGTLKGLRAFSTGGDLRVVYRETDDIRLRIPRGERAIGP